MDSWTHWHWLDGHPINAAILSGSLSTSRGQYAGRREDNSILCFVYNEYFEYVIVIIPLQGSLLGRLNRKILFWKHNNILFLFSVLQR